MTVAGWIFFGAAAVIIATVGIAIIASSKGSDHFMSNLVVTIVVGAVLITSVYLGFHWYFTNTESGKRAIKTQESNFEGGIKRSVKVYDAVGNLLKEYEGTFDVDFSGDNQRILFDDENGQRHVIYFKTGTVIVEETNE